VLGVAIANGSSLDRDPLLAEEEWREPELDELLLLFAEKSGSAHCLAFLLEGEVLGGPVLALASA